VSDKPQARWAPLVAGLVGWLLLCAPALTPGAQLGERDTARLYYPIKKLIAEGLRHGQLRFWDPQAEAGVSLLGQVTPGLLHPLNLLYLLPFDLAFKCNHLVALFLGGLGVFWLARRLGCSAWAALAGAFVFGGSGALVSASSSNLPYALGPATVPLAIAALFWFVDRPSALRLLGASWLLALCAYAGDPQSLGIAILIGVLWKLRSWRLAALWALCGVLLAAPVALPAAAQLRRSARIEGLDVRETQSFSTAPLRLFGLLVPRAFDAQEPEPGKRADVFSEYFAGPANSTAFLGSILLGAPALLFAFGALGAGRRARFPLCAALVLLVAATGDALGLQGFLSAVVPGWRYFRYAEKLILPASWLIAIAAAIGAEQAQRARRPAIVLIVVSMVVAATIFLARAPFLDALRAAGRTHDPDLPAVLLGDLLRGLLLTAAFSAAVLLVARKPRWAPLVCAVPLLLDAPLWTVDVDLFHGPSSTGRAALGIAGPSEGRWRLWVDASGPLLTPGGLELHAARVLAGREALLPQLQALDGIEGLAPYFSAPDAHFVRALQLAHEEMFELFGVGVVVDRSGRPPLSESGYSLLQRPLRPRAFVVREARVASDIAALAGLDVHRVALLPSGPLREAESQAELKLARPSPEEMTIDIQSPTAGLLVVAEHFDPGWSARIDGVPAKVEEADFSALGVRLPAGQHRVALRFFPRGLAPGLAIAALLTAALLGIAARRRVR
jgi:hypothetical protein